MLDSTCGLRSFKIALQEERPEFDSDRPESLGTACLPVDHADRVVDSRAQSAELFARREYLTTRGDHILYHKKSSPGDLPASARRQVPYSLGRFRTKIAGRPVRRDRAVANGTPPSSRPARASVADGTIVTRLSAIAPSRTGSASNRYLSKYSVVTAPDRSRNSPRNLEACAIANASLILLIMSV